MIFIAIRAARDAFAIICVECGAGECGASFHAVTLNHMKPFVEASRQHPAHRLIALIFK